MEKVLFRSFGIWTVLGLLGGLGYRELTRAQDFTGQTQLAVVHTHALVLGSVFLLIVLVLERVFTLSADRGMRWFAWVWNGGLALTITGLTVKGTLQVLGSTAADSPAIAGVSGTGHMLLAAGFALLVHGLGRRLSADANDARVSVPVAG
ncbi:DUF2871 domain-containing protein [Smaragdicoccus niigatensis]|uniref:DUF2871 domain-containing protein n=1 Tax=Smaragdicoccus niigatensis TaxID=359359 RepID=UPI00036C191C|nr:DUF2871 domain-containing protein [Smaragdicoccus niigatensis]